jgi:Tol biopolymer transport system component
MAEKPGVDAASKASPSSQAIRAQLKRLLGHEIFLRSERISRFLQYAVEETLAGRGGELKEQVLAAELYGKKINSEADDSTVRVDARRLRDKLREYYVERPRDPIVVALPKGAYMPTFQWNEAAAMPKAVPVVPAPTARPLVSFPSRAVIFTVIACLAGIATAAAWYITSQIKPQELRVATVTSYPGGENQPSLSPDGHFVAFMWSGSEAFEPQRIWVKAVDSEALHPLTSGPFPEVSPAWSPDGREIAFVRPGRGVYVVSHLGGPERQVASTGGFVAWAPDGQSVLIRDRVAAKPHAVFEIVLGTGERRTVFQPITGAGIWRFSVSPDGKTVAVTLSERAGIGDIYLVPREGGPPQRLTYGYSVPWGLTWMPDGREIIYSADHTLWRVAVRSGKVSHLSTLVRHGLDYPTVSSPGPGRPVRLAFVHQYVEFGLRLIDLKAPLVSGSFADVKPLADSDRLEWPGMFSRDGRRFTFLSNRAGWRPELWLVNTDGTGLRQLTRFDAAEVDGGSWSPDGKQVVLDASVGGNSDIYVMPADGGPPLRLTSHPSVDRRPAWSRDGHWIYYSSDRTGRPEVWRVAAGGGDSIQVTSGGGYEPIPGLDGKTLYFLREGLTGDDFDGFRPASLMRMPLGGESEERVLEGVQFLKWAVTADGIVYLVHESGYEAIHLYDFSAGTTRLLGRLPFRVNPWPEIGHLAVSEDGRYAVTSVIERADSNISIVENFH